jgi:transcriptional regulator with XRE-family HTH domain
MTIATAKVPKFRRAIERWCDRTGVSYSDLARRIGIDPSHLSLIMSGARGMSLSHGLAIHLETGIPVEKLLKTADLLVLRSFLAADRETAAKC